MGYGYDWLGLKKPKKPGTGRNLSIAGSPTGLTRCRFSFHLEETRFHSIAFLKKLKQNQLR
jgi:hypothetical protein